MSNILQTIGILDLIFIVVLIISILVGLIRGVVREVLSLVGLFAAIYFAFNFSDMIAKNYVSKFLEEDRISYIVTFVLIIVTTLFAVTLINLLFSQLLKASGLSFINRFFGAVFGVIRGTIICAILVLVMAFIPGISQKPWWQASSLAPIFQQITKASFKYLPKEVTDYFSSAKEHVDKKTTEIIHSAVRPAATKKMNETEKTEAGKNQQTKIILQSIDESLKESQHDGEKNKASSQKSPKLILESYK